VRYRYYVCDVFTESRFGGNQLAVLPEAAGLSDRRMQQIAREFNFSETTFVLPPERGNTRRVRIYTPTQEIPFAGHPNVGTAFVLAATGVLGDGRQAMTIRFEEGAGIVPISVQYRGGDRIWCELAAPQRLSLGKTIAAESVASAVSLAPEDIVTRTHPPQVASVGLPFLMAELVDRSALERAQGRMEGAQALRTEGAAPDVHLYTRSADEFDLRARMFAPLDGVPEDPATGSANCALAALLTHYEPAADGSFQWRIAQGVEMGRPSTLEARTRKTAGVVADAWIGGYSVLVSEGFILVE
jgi:trans-2,3-dihydro-3-hydroxyanthranilate isomerase